MLRCLGVTKSNVTLAVIVRERILDTYNNLWENGTIVSLFVSPNNLHQRPAWDVLTGTCMSC